MPDKKAFMFIDGENLTFRYQDSLGAGSRPKDTRAHHLKDIYVWHPDMAVVAPMTLSRVNYYTSVVGDDRALRAAQERIAQIPFVASNYGIRSTGQVVPHVFKKERSSRKTRIVDINICVDSLRHAHQPDVDLLILASGDGDYLPLVQEIMRRGKQVYLMAFSSGLEERLKQSVDRFFSLDSIFFAKAP